MLSIALHLSVKKKIVTNDINQIGVFNCFWELALVVYY
jgi:hypothetical protein